MEKIAKFSHNCIIIRVRKESVAIRGSLYEAVRRCWRASKQKAEKAVYVLAIVSDPGEEDLEVKAVYEPKRWYSPAKDSCRENEKECKNKYGTNIDLCRNKPRIAFEGKEMKDSVYLYKLIPNTHFPRQNPFRYTY